MDRSKARCVEIIARSTRKLATAFRFTILESVEAGLSIWWNVLVPELKLGPFVSSGASWLATFEFPRGMSSKESSPNDISEGVKLSIPIWSPLSLYATPAWEESEIALVGA